MTATKPQVSTLYDNPGGIVAQVHEFASGMRVSDGQGRHIDARYDAATGAFVITAESSNIRVETGSNKIWITKR